MFIFRGRTRSKRGTEAPAEDGEALRTRCSDLERRLAESEERLKQRSELLYELQRHHSSEHFALQEYMRELKTERMRFAGLRAERDVIPARTAQLQARIAESKERPRRHEPCEDHWLDSAPMADEEPS